jgi:hypothetical protein
MSLRTPGGTRTPGWIPLFYPTNGDSMSLWNWPIRLRPEDKNTKLHSKENLKSSKYKLSNFLEARMYVYNGYLTEAIKHMFFFNLYYEHNIKIKSLRLIN